MESFVEYSRKTINHTLKGALLLVLLIALTIGDFLLYTVPQLQFLSMAETAYAATGDFSIFRETSGGTTIDSSGTPLDLTWDTTVSGNGNIALQGNNSDVNLAEGGKYLVMYTAWAHEGSAGGTNRRGLASYLSLEGTNLAYGRGSGYIRDNEGDTSAYVNGAAFVDAAAGDDLQLHLVRRDGNTTGGTEVQPAVNALQVIKMPDDAAYTRLRQVATSSAVNANTAFTDVSWDQADEVDVDAFSFTPSSADVTLKGPANTAFLVTFNLSLFDTSGGGTRQNYEARLTLDGTELPGTRSTTYIRGTDNHWFGQITYSGIIVKSSASDQTLNVELRRESSGSANTVLVGNESSLSVMEIPDTVELIKISDNSGTQTTSLSANDMTFNSTDLVTSSAFSHSTTVNPERVTVQTPGDYLFFATAYTETTTSGNNRQPFRANWKVNGTTQPYGSFGAYNRANSTFTGGASGAIILPALSANDYVSLEHIDETTSTPVDATFAANRVALQGVLLNDNFYGTDVRVSAQGSHITSADIGNTDVYTGGVFVIEEQTASRNVTNITLSEQGTVDGQNALENIKLYYEYDTTSPYDCASESYDGIESQYGSTDINGFSAADGISSFADTVSISITQALCLYPVLDINAAANDLDTIHLAIESPTSDVLVTGSGSVAPADSVAPSGAVTVRGPQLTQTHYHWLNDDGIEGLATSVDGAEDTPASGFSASLTRRLRVQVSAEGSTSSPPVELRLEYGQKVTTCEEVSAWTDVSAGGGDWDMSDSTFIVDGTSSTDLTPANGGTTNENTTHLTPNNALKDTSSQLNALTFNASNFLEMEFSVSPTLAAPQGNTYCFRVTDAGTPLKSYTTYPEGTLSADIEVSVTGTQVSTVDVDSTDNYAGGAFVIARPGGSRTLTSITLSEVGSVDATNITNPQLFYDIDTTSPYDCASESYSGTESSITGTAFSEANGTTTFTTSIALNTTSTFCGYFVYDLNSAAVDGEVVDIEITNPANDVVVTSSSVGPGSVLSLPGTTTVTGPVLTQTHFHWRLDNGSETAANSASGGNQDTPIGSVQQLDNRRLRLQVSNEGSVDAQSTSFVLQYGTKVTTCAAVASWTNLDVSESAFVMSPSSQIADGDTTNVAPGSVGEVTDENAQFVGTGMLRETTASTSAVALTASQFAEMEFSIAATEDSAYNTTYCFRVVADSNPLNQYNTYAELTTREKEDFFVQRGEETVSGTSLNVVAGIDYIAPASSTAAFVRITNSQITGAGNAAGTTNQNADDFTAYISDQSDLTSGFTISRPSAATGDTRVSWEIVEFVGGVGTDNEMIVRGSGALTVNSPDLTALGSAVSGVADISDVVVFITGQGNEEAGRANVNDSAFIADFQASTSQPTFERGDADVAAQVSYAVVEFTGVNWQIQRVAHTYTAAGTTETESITAIPSISHGFIHAQKLVGESENGLDEIGHQVWLSSLGAVSFQLRAGVSTPGLHTSVAWVIANTQNQNGEIEVYQSNGTIASGGAAATPVSIAIGSTITTDSSSIFATNDSNGAGTAYPRPIAAYTIVSPTTYELWRSETGQPIDYRVNVVDWPAADTAFTQNFYRIYTNSTSTDVTDPWPLGAADLGENEALTALDDPIGEGEVLRLRMSLQVRNANFPVNSSAFKLQYGLRTGSCSAIVAWSDVGAVDSGDIWRGYDQTGITDGSPITTETPAPGALKLSVSDTAATVEEENNSDVNPYKVSVGDDVEYDWVVQHNGAAQRSDYCFRMVYSDGDALAAYNHYPTVRTTGFSPAVRDWRWYDDETNLTPSSPLAAENVTPTDVANQNLVKLRVVVSETENADGANVKFALQYSEYADFSDGGTFLTSITDCTENSLWCYADGNGVDGATINNAVISSADSCVSGVGNGCGVRNEFATTSSSHTHTGLSNTEYEFTLRHAGARSSTVYYFRLYNVTLDNAVVASSSQPNLLTESASIDFTLDGIDAGVAIAGVTTDATSTASEIAFGKLLFDTDTEVAQSLSVDSNATEGYRILLFTAGQLTNTYGNTLLPISGTNASPSSWSTACSAAAESCFGYHPTDPTLSQGSARFAVDDTYAALHTEAREIVYSSVPVSTTNEIVFRARVDERQVAGLYETNLTYVVVPIH